MRELNGAPLTNLVEAGRAAEREGRFDVALERYESAFRRLAYDGGDAAVAADLFRWIGAAHFHRETFELAHEALDTSLAIAEAAGLADRIAAALNWTAITEQTAGSLVQAERTYLRARDIAEPAGDERLVAMIDQNLATLANIRGDVDRAVARYRSALDRLERLDEPAAARVLNNLGMAYVDVRRFAQAADCFDAAFDLANRLRDAPLLAAIEGNRAELHLRRSQPSEARECCDRAYEIWARVGSDLGLAEVHKLYGVIFRESSKPLLADAEFHRSLELARAAGDPLLEAETEAELALLHLAQERNQDALRSLNRAHRVFTELGARREVLDLDRRLDRLEATYLEVVRRWGESIEAKDRYTAGHCSRVADYACMLAADLGYAGRDLAWFRMGGFLHDVGKTAVPAEVLNKPGKLDEQEWALMQSHTTVGHEIVQELKFPWNIEPIVRSHHERWDGRGYPDGLAGEAIPLVARILTVADVYDALTTARSYRGALSHEEAMAVMARDAGRALDPSLFERFSRLIEARRTGAALSSPAPATSAAA